MYSTYIQVWFSSLEKFTSDLYENFARKYFLYVKTQRFNKSKNTVRNIKIQRFLDSTFSRIKHFLSLKGVCHEIFDLFHESNPHTNRLNISHSVSISPRYSAKWNPTPQNLSPMKGFYLIVPLRASIDQQSFLFWLCSVMYTVKFFEKIADLTPRFNAHCGVCKEFEYLGEKSKPNSKIVWPVCLGPRWPWLMKKWGSKISWHTLFKCADHSLKRQFKNNTYFRFFTPALKLSEPL